MALDVIIDITNVEQKNDIKNLIQESSIDFYEPMLTPQKLYAKIEKNNLDQIETKYSDINIKSQHTFVQM